MIWKFALRNVLRNRKRTFLTMLTVFFGALLVGLVQAWVNGMINDYIENFTRYQTGHVRVTTEEFLKREKFMPVDEVITDTAALKETIKSLEGVVRVEERVQFGILLGHREKTVQAVGMGLELSSNPLNLKEKIIKGKFTGKGIYIGYKLAKKLNVSPGEELLVATKTSIGGLNGIRVTVAGIFRLGMAYDKRYFFLDMEDTRRLLKLGNTTTALFVYGTSHEDVEKLKAMVKKVIPEEASVQTYKEQMGEFYATLETMRSFYTFFEIVVLFLASFVIINTMMMAIFERLREIGTMKAMGMTDRQIFFNFTCEGAIIGAAGGIIGAIVGFFIISYFGTRGIDFSTQLENFEMPIEYVIHPVAQFKDLLIAVAIAIIVPACAAMIPARYARKLMPAEALRK